MVKLNLVHHPSNSDGLSEGRRGGSRAASTHQIYSDGVLALLKHAYQEGQFQHRQSRLREMRQEVKVCTGRGQAALPTRQAQLQAMPHATTRAQPPESA